MYKVWIKWTLKQPGAQQVQTEYASMIAQRQRKKEEPSPVQECGWARSHRVVETSRKGLQREHSETTGGHPKGQTVPRRSSPRPGHKQATATARTELTHKKSKTRGAALGWDIWWGSETYDGLGGFLSHGAKRPGPQRPKSQILRQL